jgi:iron complex outermembrane receptor protein
VARTEQPINRLSIPVSLVTSEDIWYGGQTSLPEVLQFTPGVDFARLDRNRPVVGVRGLHGMYSDRLLVLIDGRAGGNNPSFGGVEWNRLPVPIHDIERVEIVRGPTGATWGANAVNGVINIITKDPEDVLGWFAGTTVSHAGETYSHVRYATESGRWSWMQSVTYENVESSEDFLPDDGFASRDFRRAATLFGKVAYEPSDRTRLSFGYAHSHLESGDFELIMFDPQRNMRHETGRVYARVDRKLSDGGKAHVQWFTNYYASKYPNAVERLCAVENDLEAQVSRPVGDHRLTAGGNVRLNYLGMRSRGEEQTVLDNQPFCEQWVGLFAMDRWQATDRLTLEGQIRGDWYSGSQADWAGRLAAIWALDEQKQHTLRVATARAFRAPAVGLRESSQNTMPLGGGLYGINYTKPEGDLRNEETWALELGYSGDLGNGWRVRADAYFQRYKDLIGPVVSPDPLGLGRVFSTFDNLGDARAWGGEVEVSWKSEQAEVSGWYAYNGFRPDYGDDNYRAFAPARHKAGVSARWFLPHDITLNANYRYATTTGFTSKDGWDIPPDHRLDLSLTRDFELEKGRGEFSLGVSDVTDRDMDRARGVGNYTGHPTPGRTFYVRAVLKL